MTRTTLLLAASCLLFACSDDLEPEDSRELAEALQAEGLCFSGGDILTGTDEAVTAVATQGARIIYAGADTGDWCPDGAREVDLAAYGADTVMMPGLTDAHAHLIGIGLREMTLNLEGTTSIADLQARVKAAAADLAPGETLYGRGWIETHWPEGRFPRATDIDAVVDDRPVLLERADGHAMVVNSFVLDAEGIDYASTFPTGGRVDYDPEALEDGADIDAFDPTGMLIDNAMALVTHLMPGLDADTKRRAYVTGAEIYAARGWTGIHNMSVDSDDVALLETLDAQGELPIRVYNSLDTRELDRVVDASPSDKVVTRAIKLYGDGALGSRGAALLAPYSDDPGNVGLALLGDDILPTLRDAAERGIQVNTHAIGDRANRQVLDWYEDTMPEDARWRIEHTQIVDLGDLPRYAQMGVIPSMQPSHAIGDLHFAVDRLGSERLAGGYAWRSLIDSGAVIAGGSDAPVEIGDPRIEFHASTQRTDLEGYSNADWYPQEAVTADEVLKMFTAWPARAAFQEDDLGTIEVGKLADFSVFSHSLTNGDAMGAEPVMTVVDGEVVWERD